MQKKELFAEACSIVCNFMSMENKLVEKNDANLLILYYKAGMGLMTENEHVLLRPGYEKVMEIAATIGPCALGDEVLKAMPQHLVDIHKDGQRELTEEEKEKFSLSDDDITEEQFDFVKSIVYEGADEILSIYSVVKEKSLEDKVKESGREALISSYTKFENGESFDMHDVSIDDLYFITYEVAVDHM